MTLDQAEDARDHETHTAAMIAGRTNGLRDLIELRCALRNERQCGAETVREFLELWFGETRFTAFGRCSENSAAPLLNVAWLLEHSADDSIAEL
jgi:hypothetical protein